MHHRAIVDEEEVTSNRPVQAPLVSPGILQVLIT
jgi:hypothetical protein